MPEVDPLVSAFGQGDTTVAAPTEVDPLNAAFDQATPAPTPVQADSLGRPIPSLRAGPGVAQTTTTQGPLATPETPLDWVGNLIKDTADAAIVAPIRAFTELQKAAGKTPLLGPGGGTEVMTMAALPKGTVLEDQRLAAQAGLADMAKAAGFWGGLRLGTTAGRMAGTALKPLFEAASPVLNKLGGALKAGAEVGAFSGAEKALSTLPDFMFHNETPLQYTKDVAAASAFGAATGVTFGLVPMALGGTARATWATGKGLTRMVNGALGTTGPGRLLQEKAQNFAKNFYEQVWTKAAMGGDRVLENLGLANVVERLKAARGILTMDGGAYVSKFNAIVHDLTDKEASTISGVIENIDFEALANAPAPMTLGPQVSEFLKDPRNRELWSKAQQISGMFREMGMSLKETGAKVWDPNIGYRDFMLVRKYLPHRFVDPARFLVGGDARDESIKIVAEKNHLTQEEATHWVDDFAARIETEAKEETIGTTPTGRGVTHYAMGRALGLPGYETDIRKLFPQYAEHITKRITLGTIFGDMPKNPAVKPHPLEQIQEALKQRNAKLEEQLQERIAAKAKEEAGGQVALPPLPKAESPLQKAYKALLRDEAEARRGAMLRLRYPKAFSDLEALPEQERNLAELVVRRQLGSLEAAKFPSAAFQTLAFAEVVHDLSLASVAQPTQILSGIVRTGLRSGILGLIRTLANLPAAYDFALRTGVILRGVVRQHEEALLNIRNEDFLRKVGFTQLDEFSRVVGAMQGAAYAEFMAKRLTQLVRLGEQGETKAFGYFRTPDVVRREIASLERKFLDLGINPQEVVQQGGFLKDQQMLKAGQKVSSDVNFWGDQLSLPILFKSPYGRYLTMFKSFAFQQARFVKEYVVKPAIQHDEWGPLTRMLLTMPIAGEAVVDIKKALRGKVRTDPSVGAHILTNIAGAAGFGILYDAWDATNYGLGGTLGFGAGPIVTDAAKAGLAAGQHDPARIARLALELGVPAAAVALSPTIGPYVAMAAPAVANILAPTQRGQ